MLTFRILEKRITGTFNGKPFNVPRSEKLITTLKSIQSGELKLTQAEWDESLKLARKEIVAGSNKFLAFKPVTNEYYLVVGGEIIEKAIPETLVKNIEESFEKQIDFTPLLKAWARFLQNPRFDKNRAELFDTYLSSTYTDKDAAAKLSQEEEISMEAALAACTYNDLAITQEGLLATYKVAEQVTWKYSMEQDEDGSWNKVKKPRYATIPAVIDDISGEVIEPERLENPEFAEEMIFTPAIYKSGDKFYSGDKIGYIYEVGKMQSLPKDAQRNLSNTFGGGGLYTGGLEYVDGYRSCGTHVLFCLVNPKDILSFQSEGQAMRVDAIFPNGILDAKEGIKQRNIYHSSDYDKMSEDRFAELLKDAAENQTTILESNIRANLGGLESFGSAADVEETSPHYEDSDFDDGSFDDDDF